MGAGRERQRRLAGSSGMLHSIQHHRRRAGAGGPQREGRSQGDGADDEFRDLIRRQLELLGEDPDREGLLRTPERVAKSLAWLTRGYEMDVAQVVGAGLFDAEGASNMVMVRDIE